MDAYHKRFDADPDQYSATGYLAIEMLAQGLQKTGPKVTADALAAALESVSLSSGFLGNPEYVFGPAKRGGAATVRLSQIKDGRWVVVSDQVKLR